MPNTSIQTLLQQGKDKLASHSTSAALDAELLLAHSLGKNRVYLYTWPNKAIDRESTQHKHYHDLLEQRQAGKPIAHILGKQEFWSMNLVVNDDVLIPRADTECLVEATLSVLDQNKQTEPQILELGTGSGAISLALATELPEARILACDISAKALRIAQHNSQQQKLSKIIRFIESDWFSQIESQTFDCIVSNPPYIAENDPHLQTSIRYEPIIALTSGKDGLTAIRHICQQANNYLKPNGWLLLEHGFEQAEAVKAIMQNNGLNKVETLKDYAGNDRVTKGCKA